MFLGTIPELIAVVMSLISYLKHKYPHLLYMSAAWFFLWLGNLLLAIAYLTLNVTIYKIGVLATAPLTFFIVLLMDTISRETLDPRKLFIITIVSSFVLVFAFDENAVIMNTSALGEVAPALNGRFLIAGSSLFIISGVLWFYYMLQIHLKAPKKLKKISSINLIGATIAGPSAAIAFASGLVWILPGTDYMMIGIGALICTYSFVKQPKLGYVLPFKVSRLLAIDINTGLPVYSHTWEEEGLIDSYLFSGAIHGITLILKESLHKGLVKEIRLEEGVLILKQPVIDYPIAFVLIASKTSAILHQALNIFASSFIKEYPKKMLEEIIHKAQPPSISKIVQNAFPFVVSYV